MRACYRAPAPVIEGENVVVFGDEDDEQDPQAYGYVVDADRLFSAKNAFNLETTLAFDRL